ncbi:MAG: hypothetical protein JWN98_2384 [Abditibacteriota bacterium]|nr:hypothetical protein [Abditibacteriota bacterium]
MRAPLPLLSAFGLFAAGVGVASSSLAATPVVTPAVALVVAPATIQAAIPAAALDITKAFMWKFDFGSGRAAPGYIKVAPDALYTPQSGFGFEAAGAAVAFERGAADVLRGDGCTAEKPFLFSVALPEGNYRVSMTMGAAEAATNTVVKAEARRLMLESVTTAPGQWATRSFLVNVRHAALKSGGTVRLKADEQQNHLNWDDKLTLEFNGARPTVCSLEIERDDTALTVYLAGDSTVTDQKGEPWAAWGQMLPRFFGPDVAVANHAHSGEALYSFRSERRLEKIMESIREGDYLFIQFGHNDQKDKAPGAGPFTSYRENLKYFVAQARQKKAYPVLISPMERRRFEGNTPLLTLADYAEAVRQVGREENVPVIDLHAMSLKLYSAWGPETSRRAFVHYPANTFPGQEQPLKDDTHFNAYGAYQLAKCVVEGIKSNVPALSRHLLQMSAFDPGRPDAVDSWSWALSPFPAIEKPAGS